MTVIRAWFHIRRGSFLLDAEFEVPSRGVTAVVGPSGCGKTSLLRAIAGLERHAGRLSINGEVWQDDVKRQFLPTHKRGVGFVFQDASLLPHLTVQSNMEFGWKRTATSERHIDRQQMLSLLGIEHLLNRYPAHLSGGERQRVAIARALLTSPKLLLMDEPLASLDTARKQEVLPYLERVHDALNVPILYVSHASEEVTRLADHLIVLDANKVVASGPLSEVTSQLGLPTAFQEDVGVIVTGIVETYDDAYMLGTLRIEDAHILVVYDGLRPGTQTRLQIFARDVSISLVPLSGTTVLNQLAAKVIATTVPEASSHVMVRLDACGIPLLAKISRHAQDELQINPGKQVWVQCNVVSVIPARD